MSTTALVDAMDPAVGVFGCSLVVSEGAKLAGGVEEEEAIGKNGNKKRKEKKEKREVSEAGKFKLCSFFSPFDKPRVL